MKQHITAAAALAIMALASCSEGKFHVEGKITEAEDSMLYFEQVGIDGVTNIDSVRLGADGDFSFSDERPDAPEFYRLRIAGQAINISVGSTETITIKAAYPTMATNYEVEGSPECNKIKQLAQMQIALQQRAMALDASSGLSPEEARDSLDRMLQAHKERVTRNFIFKDPKAPSSYFALFQAIGSYLIFNPQGNDADIKVFAAVATAWDTFYPGSLRGENLHNIAIEGMRNERIIKAEADKQIDPAKVTTAGLIDIRLRDNNGQMRSLTELKGKVVLLDFHLFAMDGSPERILSLREVFDGRRLTAIFQPHLYSRTRDFYTDFADSLSLLDEVILTEIYPAREAPIPGVTSQLIYDRLRPGMDRRMCRKADVPRIVEEGDFDVLMLLGAGDLDDYAPQLTEVLRRKYLA